MMLTIRTPYIKRLGCRGASDMRKSSKCVSTYANLISILWCKIITQKGIKFQFVFLSQTRLGDDLKWNRRISPVNLPDSAVKSRTRANL